MAAVSKKRHGKSPLDCDKAAAKKALAILKGAPHLRPEEALRAVGGWWNWANALQLVLGKRRRV
jgi:hypothetical protein